MGAFDNRARRDERKAIAQMISDDPVEFQIRFKGTPDKMKGNKAAETVLGSFTGTLAEFRQSRAYPTYDEKGTNSHHPFVLLALDVPEGSFQLQREVIIAGRTYVVTSMPEVGEFSEINLDLVV